MTGRTAHDPHPLVPDDPGLQGENLALVTKRSTMEFGEALKRAGHGRRAAPLPDRASLQARQHLLAVLAEQGRR